MARLFWVLGCGFAFLGVAAGAFGAHALRQRVPDSLLAVFETAVRYQMYHAFALLAVALLLTRGASPAAHLAGWLFAAGMFVFSGSLYVLVLSELRWVGAITPFGGLALLGGWLALAWAGGRALAG